MRTRNRNIALPTIDSRHEFTRQEFARRGFTLVELLVVITIIIILTALTFTLVNFSMDAERLSSGSRQIQGYLEGARDRAIHADEPRGVRFILDPLNPIDPNILTVSSVVYIGPPKTFSEGQITIGDPADIADKRKISITGANWNGLVDIANPANSFLLNGARIRIGDLNIFYTVVQDATSPSGWSLTRDFQGQRRIDELDITSDFIPYEYKLELAPAILADQEPTQLPRNIVIDLNGSRIPLSWLTNTSRMDVLFSPRGTVIGTAATKGLIHLLLSDRKDVENLLGLGDPNKTQGELLVTIVTKTGAINTHHVDPTDNDGVGGADDPFKFAETGKEAK